MTGFLGKIHRCIACVALLVVVLFTSNSFASGYVCEKTYTSCRAEYYLSDGNCLSCPTGCTCAGGDEDDAPVCKVTITYNLNGGSGTAPSATTCTKDASCTLTSMSATTFYKAG